MSPPARRPADLPRRVNETASLEGLRSSGVVEVASDYEALASPLLCLERDRERQRDRGRAEVNMSQRYRTERLNSRVWLQMKYHSCRERIVRGWQFWRPVDSAPFLEEESR